jgi:glycosyltransferase involved in cell wall biosynthesis
MLTILNTAAVYAEKDPSMWIEAVETVRASEVDFRALWIGAVHPDFAVLTAAAQLRSGGKIAFAGARSNAEVLQQLSGPGQILLISSTIEVFPMSILEAAQHGVPVVTRRFPGWEEVVGPDYDLSFSTVGEAAEKLRRVADDYEAWSRSARALFDSRFRKDASWYATGEAIIERVQARPR